MVRTCFGHVLRLSALGIDLRLANSALEAAELLTVCDLQDAQRELLRSAMTRLQLSGRAVHRVLRVARTIADLAGEATVTQEALHEALAYRLDGPAPP